MNSHQPGSADSMPDDFRALQYAFTRHLRDPDTAPAPADIEERRMAIYRDLLYRNIESFLANSFPVLRKVTPHDRWHAMVRDYFRSHCSQTPLFPRMPEEFLAYLEQERDVPDDPAWLQELARYEWQETSLAIDAREIEPEGVDPEGDPLAGIPIPNPLIQLTAYTWPVHRISPEYQPDTPPEQPTYLVVYRDRDDRVGFLELNAVSARLLDLLQQNDSRRGRRSYESALPSSPAGRSPDPGQNASRSVKSACGRELLLRIAEELNHPDPDVVVRGGLETLQTFRAHDVVLGTLPLSAEC